MTEEIMGNISSVILWSIGSVDTSSRSDDEAFLAKMYPTHICQYLGLTVNGLINTLRPRQNGCHFADDIFNRIFLNETVWFPIKISLKFVPNCLIDNIPALVQIISWRRPGDKPLSEPMLVSLLMHICVAQPQWVKIWTTIYWNHLFSTNMESVCRSTGYVKNISFTTHFNFRPNTKYSPPTDCSVHITDQKCVSGTSASQQQGRLTCTQITINMVV